MSNLDRPVLQIPNSVRPETKALIAARSARLAESKEARKSSIFAKPCQFQRHVQYHHLSAGGNRKNAKLEQYLENDRKAQQIWGMEHARKSDHMLPRNADPSQVDEVLKVASFGIWFRDAR